MLDCAWKPTRHPARSPSAAVVSTISGGSAEPISVSNASSLTFPTCLSRSLVAEEEGVCLNHGGLQLEHGEPCAGWGHGDRKLVTAHERRYREAQLIEAVRCDEFPEPGRAALTEHHPVAEPSEGPHRGSRLDTIVTCHDDGRDRLGLGPAHRIRGRTGDQMGASVLGRISEHVCRPVESERPADYGEGRVRWSALSPPLLLGFLTEPDGSVS